MPTHVEAVTLKLREMVVSGELKPGSRVPERDLAMALGVSRTPVRVALGILEAEGLVTGEPNRGFVVCDFSIEDALSAFDVRGALESLAAQTAIERGVTPAQMDQLRQCVAEGDRLIAANRCGADEMRRWSVANDLFHSTIIEAAALPTLLKVHHYMSRMPLVAPIAILFTSDQRDDALARMIDAHGDHVHILSAFERGEAARAGFLMREHIYRSRNHLERLLRSQSADDAPADDPIRRKRIRTYDRPAVRRTGVRKAR